MKKMPDARRQTHCRRFHEASSIPGQGLAKGWRVTFKTMIRTIFLPNKYLATINYPVEKETPVPGREA